MTTTAENRETFLWALRSGLYPKGPIETDSRGRPADLNATGFCAVGLAYHIFCYDASKPDRGRLAPTPR